MKQDKVIQEAKRRNTTVERMIPELFQEHKTTSRVASALNVSRQTIWRWLDKCGYELETIQTPRKVRDNANC